MRDIYIGCSIVDFVAVLEVNIHKKANEHGTAKIRGLIKSECEEELLKKAESGYASLFIRDESGKQQNIFSGIIECIEIENSGGVKNALLMLAGATKLMDCVKHTHTFQNESMLYGKLVRTINAGNGQVICVFYCGEYKKIGNLIVQYRETDWEFVKRIASHFNQPLIPNYAKEGIRYSFGLCETCKEKILDSVLQYAVGSARGEYLNKKRNKVAEILPEDFVFYTIKSREYLELGDKIQFMGKILYVYEVSACLKGEELLHTYILRRAGGFRTVCSFNTMIIGSSLDAVVMAAKNDTVKVAVSVDGGQKESEAKWFPYSTVYSSPDGSGWYCMPEKNDKVRLYFPSEHEEDSYVISAINQGNAEKSDTSVSERIASDNIPRSDPDRKSISNKYGKQVELTPTSIIMTNNKGMSIILDDEKGIEMICDKSVVINATDSLIMKSDTGMDIQATDYIELSQGETQLILQDELKIKGTKFKMQ